MYDGPAPILEDVYDENYVVDRGNGAVLVDFYIKKWGIPAGFGKTDYERLWSMELLNPWTGNISSPYQTFFETNRNPKTSMGTPIPRKNNAATNSNGLFVVSINPNDPRKSWIPMRDGRIPRMINNTPADSFRLPFTSDERLSRVNTS